MVNMPKEWPIEQEYKDVESLNFYGEAKASGDAERIRKTEKGLKILARDHSRIPMQWDASPNAGFTSAGVMPWMRVHDGFKDLNVEKQEGDDESVLRFYKKILKMRKEYSGLFVHGAFRPVLQEDETLFVYVKDDQGSEESGVQVNKRRKALVAMNFSGQPASLQEHDLDVAATLGCKHGEELLLVTTLKKNDFSRMEAGVLKPWESRVYLNF